MKFSTSKRVLAAGAAAALAAVTLAACSSGSSSDDATKDEVTAIKLVVAPIHYEPAYIAKEQGFFAEEGLDVTIIPGADAAANMAQAMSGSADIVTASWTNMVTSTAQGVPIKIVGTNGVISAKQGESGVLVPPDSSLKSIADLKGKTLGVLGIRTGSDIGVLLAAEAAGISADSITEVAIPYSGMQAALETGQVDAVMVTDPYYSQMVEAGNVDLGDVNEFTNGLPSTLWAATTEWLKSHEKAAEAFVAAMKKADAYYKAHPDEAKQITAKVSKIDVSKVPEPATISLSIDVAKAKKNIKDLEHLGYVENPKPLDEILWSGAPRS